MEADSYCERIECADPGLEFRSLSVTLVRLEGLANPWLLSWPALVPLLPAGRSCVESMSMTLCFHSALCNLLRTDTQVGYFIYRGLSLLICKMGKIMPLSSGSELRCRPAGHLQRDCQLKKKALPAFLSRAPHSCAHCSACQYSRDPCSMSRKFQSHAK